MNRMLVVFLCVFCMCFSGCSLIWPDGDDNKPEPPVPTAVAKIEATIVNQEFRVNGQRVMGMGVYDLFSNEQAFPESSIPGFFQYWSDAGCNFMRPWVVCYFRPTDWIPFAWDNGKINLGRMNPNYVNRFRMICQEAARHDVCLGIVLWDFCTLRRGFGYAPPNGVGYYDIPHWLSPNRHIDPWASGNEFLPMMTYHGFYEDEACTIPYYNGKPRTRRLYRCEYQNGQQCGPCAVESGSRLHPAWPLLIDAIVPIAREYGHIIYIASEMGTSEEENNIWDEAAKGEFIVMMRDRIKAHYPGVIIGNSLPDVNYRLYGMTDISDIHGLGYGVVQDPERIAESAAMADSLGIKRPICYNNDGWVNDYRFEPNVIEACIRESWKVGGFFETKACHDTLELQAEKINAGFSAMKDQR